MSANQTREELEPKIEELLGNMVCLGEISSVDLSLIMQAHVHPYSPSNTVWGLSIGFKTHPIKYEIVVCHDHYYFPPESLTESHNLLKAWIKLGERE